MPAICCERGTSGLKDIHRVPIAASVLTLIFILFATSQLSWPANGRSSVFGVSSVLGWLTTLTPRDHRSGTWSTLPSKRTLVVQFASIERIEEFNTYWQNHESRFMMHMTNASLLLGCPYLDESAVLTNIVKRHNWTLVTRLDHLHPLAHGPLSVYRTGHGVEILVQPIIISIPRYYMNSKPSPPTCDGRNWTLSYAMYSGAVFSYHLLQLPVITKYDVFVKVDTDVEFKKHVPIDIGQDMQKRSCLIGHTAIVTSSDCERDSVRALISATAHLHLSQSKSINYGWCNRNNASDQMHEIFYGNFIAFSTTLLLHPDIQVLSQYLFDDWQNGYFGSRWGDQAPFILYTCHLLDIPNLRNDTQVCDYSEYRNSIFVHHN